MILVDNAVKTDTINKRRQRAEAFVPCGALQRRYGLDSLLLYNKCTSTIKAADCIMPTTRSKRFKYTLMYAFLGANRPLQMILNIESSESWIMH